MSGMTLERGLLDALKRLAAATKAEKGGGVIFSAPRVGVLAGTSYAFGMTLSIERK